MTPALHSAATSGGNDTRNIGAPITGATSLPFRAAGIGMAVAQAAPAPRPASQPKVIAGPSVEPAPG